METPLENDRNTFCHRPLGRLGSGGYALARSFRVKNRDAGILKVLEVSCFVFESLLLDQLGLLVVLGLGQGSIKIDQVQRGQVLAFEEIDQVAGRIECGSVDLLHGRLPPPPKCWTGYGSRALEN